MRKKYVALLSAMVLGGTLISGQLVADIHDGTETAGTPSETTQLENTAAVEQAPDKERQNAEMAREIVVARVNGSEVSMLSLVRAMNRLAPRYVQPGEEISPELTEKIKKEALDGLISEELSIQASYGKDIVVAPEDIEEVIGKVKESLGDEDDYRNYLEERDLTEEMLRSQIERSRRREIVTAREIYGKVKVSEEKIAEAYERMKEEGKLRTADEFIVKEILLMNGKDDEETRKRAEELLTEVKKDNGEFGNLILDGTFITRRMKIQKNKYPVIYEQMQEMEIDQLSDVVKDGDTYHIFKVVKKEPARDLSLKEARGYIENRLRVPAQEERKAAWEEELRENAEIEVLLDQVEEQLKKKAEAGKTEAQT